MRNNTKITYGFTLVEVVTVLVLIGILAVIIVPKFNGTSSFEAYPYRSEMISKLRLAQQRAMQQTNTSDNYCHQIVIEPKRFGTPDRVDCTITTFPSNWQPDAVGLEVEHSVSYSITGKTKPIIDFNSMGVPLKDCLNGCIINVVSSEETLQIKIESQGYIHAI